MAIDKINIQEKADNPNKKALLARLGVPQDESLSAQETNKLVGKTNELVDKTNELNFKFDSYKPVDAFNFKGNVATYANLPTTGLTKDDAYGVIADGLVYIYNGTSFPTSGNGLDLGLKPTPDSKVTEGNELAVSGGEVYKDFYKVKTYNLLDEKYIVRGKALTSDGGLQNYSSYNVAFKVPVLPNENYTFYNLGSIRNIVLYDENGVFIEIKINALNRSIPVVYKIPSNAYYISYYLPDNTGGVPSDLSKMQLTKGDELFDFLPPTVTKDLDYYVLKDSYNKSELTRKTIFLNENINSDFISTQKADYSLILPPATSLKPETTIPSVLKKYGITGIHKIGEFATPVSLMSGLIKTYDTPISITDMYVYASNFLVTDDLSFIPTISNNTVYGDTFNGIKIANVVKNKITKISDGIFRYDSICKLLPENYTRIFIRTGGNNIISQGKNFRISPTAYCMSEKLHNVDTLYPELIGENKILFEALISKKEVVNTIEQSLRNKKWVLYGTSIEAGGYFDKVALAYNANYINYGNGGGGILWTDNPIIGGQIWNNPNDASPQKAWSATWAEKQSYLTANSIPITSTSETDCYDKNLLTNLDADLFFIGTYGINDRRSQNNSAFVIDKVNRKYDRTTIYGAYNYILRRLFEAKPTARVVIFGQHCFGWTNTPIVNEIQREVAKDWCIPFLDWGYKMGMSNEAITVGGVNKTVLTASYASDGAHPDAKGKDVMANYLIRALRDII